MIADDFAAAAVGTLRDWRLECGVTQHQLAFAMRVTPKNISLYEHRPLATMSLSTLDRRAEALKSDLLICVLLHEELIVLTGPPGGDGAPVMSLRQLRERCGLSQTEVQERAKVAAGRISSLERRAITQPQLSSLCGYLRGLGLTQVYLCAVLPDGRVMVVKDAA